MMNTQVLDYPACKEDYPQPYITAQEAFNIGAA